MDIDNMLLDLEVIRQLAENDKLAVNVYPGVTTLIVDKSSYLSSITRKINGYSRDDSIKYLENLVKQIEKSCDVIKTGNHSELAERLQKSIKNAIGGLERLQKTYQKDSIIVAKIVLIVNKLNTIIESFEFSNISFDELTKIENNQNAPRNQIISREKSNENNAKSISNELKPENSPSYSNFVKSNKSNKSNP